MFSNSKASLNPSYPSILIRIESSEEVDEREEKKAFIAHSKKRQQQQWREIVYVNFTREEAAMDLNEKKMSFCQSDGVENFSFLSLFK